MATTTLVRGDRKLQGNGKSGIGNRIHEPLRPAAPQVDDSTLVLQEIVRLVEASKEGRLSERGKSTAFNGVHREIVQGVNQMLDAILLPIAEGNRILAQISSGKVDELILQTYRGDHEKMKVAVNNVAVVVQALEKEMGRLTEASKEGQLSERGKPEQFQGAYAEIVRGVNVMLALRHSQRVQAARPVVAMLILRFEIWPRSSRHWGRSATKSR